MRSAIGTLGDRLVSLVVPKVSAGACYPPDPWTELCSCPAPYKKGTWRNCSYNCAGVAHCGACYTVIGLCNF
jgi:hypothetical protein